MSRVFLAIAILLGSTSFAGNDVGGGGLAEKHLVFAFVNLKTYANFCLSSDACRLDADEKKFLKKIVETLPQELPADKAIVFGSEKKTPGFFNVDGEVRAAKTGFKVGSVIYVNVDHLYTPKPITLPEAVALLIHELGHHQGEIDHTKLDLLGSKVQNMLSKNTANLRGSRDNLDVSVSVFDEGSKASYSRVLVTDGEQLVDISKKIHEKASCITGSKTGVYFWNLHWARYHHFLNGKATFLFRGLLLANCAPTQTAEYLYVSLPYTFEKSQIRLLTDNIEVNDFPPSGDINFN